jgi:hypothetical protein
MRKIPSILCILALWAVTAWLLLPLIQLDSVNIENAKLYLYRSAAGILIMVILLGKTIFDLLYSQHVSQKKSLLNTVFLTVYSIVVTGGLIYMAARMITVFLQSKEVGFPY